MPRPKLANALILGAAVIAAGACGQVLVAPDTQGATASGSGAAVEDWGALARMAPPVVAAPAPVASVEPSADATGPLDLLAWRAKPREPRQLSLFDLDPSPSKA